MNQIAKQGSSADVRDRRFDVTLLISGLPIVQIELKQVTAKDGVFLQAFNQIKNMLKKVSFVITSFQRFNCLLSQMNKRRAILPMQCLKTCIGNFCLVGGQETTKSR